MKICFATYESVPLAKGGPFVKIMEMKKQLETMGNEVELFNMWQTNEKLNDFDIIHLVGSNLSIFGLARSLKFRSIKFLVEPVFFSRRSPAQLKFISSFDALNKKIIPGFWHDYGFIRDICSWAELVLPNTTAEKELLCEGFNIPETKFRILPNGVSEQYLNADPSLFTKKYGVTDFILTVGHIGPKRKNILALVKALEKIDHPSVIIGKMLETEETSEVKEVLSRCKTINWIDELAFDSPLLASAYAACNVFALPSRFETPGIAALEAGLAGAKIVITPHGGTKEYFGTMAEYINPYSVDSIQNGIVSALNRKKNSVLQNHIRSEFLWSKIAEKTLAVYKSVPQ